MTTSRASDADLVQEVREKYDELTQSQKKIAETLMDDLEFAAFSTVDQFAAQLGVSPSTVVRFAYRLGFDGWPQLQDRVRELMMRRMKRAHPPGSESAAEPPQDGPLWHRSLWHDMHNIDATLGMVEEEQFEAAVTRLSSARRIVVVGNLTSHCIASYAAMAINRLRGGTVLMTNESMDLLDVGGDDAVLVVTFPPYARRSSQVVEWAKARGASVVVITDGPLSPVAQQASVLLVCPASGLAAQNSLVAALALVNAVVNAMTVADPDRAIARYGEVNELLSELDTYVLKPETLRPDDLTP